MTARRANAETSKKDQSTSIQDSVSERRIVLLGKTGLGKSASGNTILGREVFESEFSFESVTQMCEVELTHIGVKQISVTDTPGLFDTKKTNEELKGEIEKCLQLSKPGPHVFLLVISLDVTLTEEEQKAVTWIRENFGEEALRHFTIVLLTHGDVLGGITVEEYLGKGHILPSIVSQCGDRYHVFNNGERNDRTQVHGLLEKIEEMVKSNGEKYYTREMYKEAQRKIGGEGQGVDPLLHQVKNMTVGLQDEVARNRNMKELQNHPKKALEFQGNAREDKRMKEEAEWEAEEEREQKLKAEQEAEKETKRRSEEEEKAIEERSKRERIQKELEEEKKKALGLQEKVARNRNMKELQNAREDKRMREEAESWQRKRERKDKKHRKKQMTKEGND